MTGCCRAWCRAGLSTGNAVLRRGGQRYRRSGGGRGRRLTERSRGVTFRHRHGPVRLPVILRLGSPSSSRLGSPSSPGSVLRHPPARFSVILRLGSPSSSGSLLRHPPAEPEDRQLLTPVRRCLSIQPRAGPDRSLVRPASVCPIGKAPPAPNRPTTAVRSRAILTPCPSRTCPVPLLMTFPRRVAATSPPSPRRIRCRN